MTQIPANDPQTEQTLHVLNQFSQAFNQHAVEQIMALMTSDCVFENTYPAPDGTRLEGQQAVRAYWEQLFRESPQADFAAEELFACADRGVVRWRYSWIDSQGQAGHVRGVDIFRVQAGKVAEKFSYVKG
jgi:ketosteroid isomerase-like protein